MKTMLFKRFQWLRASGFTRNFNNMLVKTRSAAVFNDDYFYEPRHSHEITTYSLHKSRFYERFFYFNELRYWHETEKCNEGLIKITFSGSCLLLQASGFAWHLNEKPITITMLRQCLRSRTAGFT